MVDQSHDEVPDEEFDRLWEEAVINAAGKQKQGGSKPRDRSDPVENKTPRPTGPHHHRHHHHHHHFSHAGARGGSRTRSQSIPKKPKQRPLSEGKLNPSNLSALPNKGTRRAGAVRRRNSHAAVVPSSSASILSNFSAGRPAEFDPGHDARRNIQAIPSSSASILSNFSDGRPVDPDPISTSLHSNYSGVLLGAKEQGFPTDETSRALVLSSEPKKQPHRVVAPQSPNSYGNTKSNLLREMAQFVLQSEPPSSEGKKGGESNGRKNHSANPYILPTTLKVMAQKRSRNHPSGLVLSLNQRNEIGTVMVKDITPQSIFMNTALRAGHEILAINGHRVRDPQKAAEIMKGTKGFVELLLSDGNRPPGTRYERVKASPEIMDKGAGIQLQSKRGLVRVTHVDPDGLFAHSGLHPGDLFLTINGIVAQDANQTGKLLMDHLNHGLVCVLVYSMADLRMGLVEEFFSDGWEVTWSNKFQEVTVARVLNGKVDERKFTMILNFNRWWSCQCEDPLGALGGNTNQAERSVWEIILQSEVESLLEKINGALALVIEKLREATSDALALHDKPIKNLEEKHFKKMEEKQRYSDDDDIQRIKVPKLENATDLETIRKKLVTLRELYHPRKVKLVDAYDDDVFVHMAIRLVEDDKLKEDMYNQDSAGS